MRMRVMFLAIALLVPSFVRAAEAPKLGAGVALGVPFGVTAKYAFSPLYAAQSHAGVSDGDFTMNADFLRNFNDVLPRKVKGTWMPLYAGLGRIQIFNIPSAQICK